MAVTSFGAPAPDANALISESSNVKHKLTSIGINPQFITFTNVTMELDKYICIRETSPQNSPDYLWIVEDAGERQSFGRFQKYVSSYGCFRIKITGAKFLIALQKDLRERFESFSRVSVRRLGRLLPTTRWVPFNLHGPQGVLNHLKYLLGTKGFVIVCVAEGAGQTDLAQHHPYTKALKNFGNRAPENKNEVVVEISRDGKKLAVIEL
ncbi:hypothetical protein ACS0TY_026435 [Phlomoides rotata]